MSTFPSVHVPAPWSYAESLNFQLKNFPHLVAKPAIWCCNFIKTSPDRLLIESLEHEKYVNQIIFRDEKRKISRRKFLLNFEWRMETPETKSRENSFPCVIISAIMKSHLLDFIKLLLLLAPFFLSRIIKFTPFSPC